MSKVLNALENKYKLLQAKADEPNNHLVWTKRTKKIMFYIYLVSVLYWKAPYKRVIFLFFHTVISCVFF